jgi:hypothetical protein
MRSKFIGVIYLIPSPRIETWGTRFQKAAPSTSLRSARDDRFLESAEERSGCR